MEWNHLVECVHLTWYGQEVKICKNYKNLWSCFFYVKNKMFEIDEVSVLERYVERELVLRTYVAFWLLFLWYLPAIAPKGFLKSSGFQSFISPHNPLHNIVNNYGKSLIEGLKDAKEGENEQHTKNWTTKTP